MEQVQSCTINLYTRMCMHKSYANAMHAKMLITGPTVIENAMHAGKQFFLLHIKNGSYGITHCRESNKTLSLLRLGEEG